MNTEKVDEKDIYPADFPLRVIANAAELDEAALRRVVNGACVVEPLAAGNISASGKYRTWTLTVHFSSRDEHFALDEAIKQVKGVKILM